MDHMIVRVSGAIKRGENRNGKPTGRVVVKDVFPMGEESMSSGLRIKDAGGM